MSNPYTKKYEDIETIDLIQEDVSELQVDVENIEDDLNTLICAVEEHDEEIGVIDKRLTSIEDVLEKIKVALGLSE